MAERHFSSVGPGDVAMRHRSSLAQTRMHAHVLGAEKPTAALINVIDSIVPAAAGGRSEIRLCFAFIGSCLDNGGLNRQRDGCGQQ
jgi:hypothetical protein